MRISCWSSYLCSSELVDASACRVADRVGRETLAVVDVVDLDALVLADAGDVEQPAVDRARAFVMQLRMGDLGAVDLGFEHGQMHGHAPRGGGRRRILQVRGASDGTKARERRHVMTCEPASTERLFPHPLP